MTEFIKLMNEMIFPVMKNHQEGKYCGEKIDPLPSLLFFRSKICYGDGMQHCILLSYVM